MRPCLEHDFKLLTSLSPTHETSNITDFFRARLGPLVLDSARSLGLRIQRDFCYIAYDYDTLTISATESADKVTT